MSTSGEISDAISTLDREMEAVGRMAEASVCALYLVDARAEAVALIAEERCALAGEYERALEREECERESLRRIVSLSGLRLLPADRLMLETGFF
jgi:hypothetical protein